MSSRSKRTVTTRKVQQQQPTSKPEMKKQESDQQLSPMQQKYLKMEQFFTTLRSDQGQLFNKLSCGKMGKNIVSVSDANIMGLNMETSAKQEAGEEEQDRHTGVGKMTMKQQLPATKN